MTGALASVRRAGPLGVVVGMADEARCLGGAVSRGGGGEAGLTVAIAAASAVRAGREARRLADAGAGALVSFGIGGGLAPALRPGTLVVASRVCHPDGRVLAVCTEWAKEMVRAATALLPVPPCFLPVTGSDSAVVSVVEKAALHRATGAALVDMESHSVAGVATERSLPLLVLRVVADPAERSLPALALAGLDNEGRTRPWPVICGLLRHPWQVPALLGLARDSGAAFRTLARVAPLVVLA